jgi:hypothetical protein
LEGEERERLSEAEPPGGTVADERVKLVWACKRLLNGKIITARRTKLLKRVDIFIRIQGLIFGYPPEKQG